MIAYAAAAALTAAGLALAARRPPRRQRPTVLSKAFLSRTPVVSALGRPVGTVADLRAGTPRHARIEARLARDRELARVVVAYRRAHGIGKIGPPRDAELAAAQAWKRRR